MLEHLSIEYTIKKKIVFLILASVGAIKQTSFFLFTRLDSKDKINNTNITTTSILWAKKSLPPG
uniref:Uncharacterized protein n=1 Tax=Phlebia radiata TaxID=5308 RepID=L8B9E3_PHLRA|nr:hypothetical protein PRA_mt0024 [Phlebia radiata]CCE89169.1 hypothetical protein PRA_mt0024 [Phlebia radiata]